MESVSSVQNEVTTEPVSPVTTPAEAEETSESSGFESLLRSLVKPADGNKVSEEELFAGLIHERIKKLKGDEAASAYDSALEKHKAANMKPDGFIPFEQSAKQALAEITGSGVLSSEESQKVYSQAFAGAQLDSNKDALYDNRGGPGDPSIAVEAMETALLASKLLIEKLDSGEEEGELRDLGEEMYDPRNGGAAGGGVSIGDPVSLLSSTQSPNGNYMDGEEGFLFKPVSNSHGNLCVLLPGALMYQVESLILRGAAGEELERGEMFSDDEGREKYVFNKPGASYGDNLVVEATLKNGEKKLYNIPDGAQRYD